MCKVSQPWACSLSLWTQNAMLGAGSVVTWQQMTGCGVHNEQVFFSMWRWRPGGNNGSVLLSWTPLSGPVTPGLRREKMRCRPLCELLRSRVLAIAGINQSLTWWTSHETRARSVLQGQCEVVCVCGVHFWPNSQTWARKGGITVGAPKGFKHTDRVKQVLIFYC